MPGVQHKREDQKPREQKYLVLCRVTNLLKTNGGWTNQEKRCKQPVEGVIDKAENAGKSLRKIAHLARCRWNWGRRANNAMRGQNRGGETLPTE